MVTNEIDMSLEQALEKYEPMIHRFLKSAKTNTACTYEDLCQEGRMAIITAYKTYDPSKGASFTTWAYHMIRDSLIEYQKQNLSLLSGGQYLHNVLKKAGEDATVEQIMSFGVSEKTARQAQILKNSYSTAPLEDLVNYISCEEDVTETVEHLDWRSVLDPLEQKIISDLFGFDGPRKSLQDIAKDLHISRKSASYHKEIALSKLRHMPGIEAYFKG